MLKRIVEGKYGKGVEKQIKEKREISKSRKRREKGESMTEEGKGNKQEVGKLGVRQVSQIV